MKELMCLPRCTVHDEEMIYEAPRSPEQEFVGALYRCPKCMNSVLIPSRELLDFLEDMHRRKK